MGQGERVMECTHHESRRGDLERMKRGQWGGANENKLWLMYKNKDNASSMHAKRNFRLVI